MIFRKPETAHMVCKVDQNLQRTGRQLEAKNNRRKREQKNVIHVITEKKGSWNIQNK